MALTGGDRSRRASRARRETATPEAVGSVAVRPSRSFRSGLVIRCVELTHPASYVLKGALPECLPQSLDPLYVHQGVVRRNLFAEDSVMRLLSPFRESLCRSGKVPARSAATFATMRIVGTWLPIIRVPSHQPVRST